MDKSIVGIRIHAVGPQIVLYLDYSDGSRSMTEYDIDKGVPPRLLTAVIGAVRDMCMMDSGYATEAALPPYPNW